MTGKPRPRIGVVLIICGFLAGIAAFVPSASAAGEPVVTKQAGVNGCNGVRTTPGSENTHKRLDPNFPSDFNPGGTVGYIIDFPVDPEDAEGRTTFEITDCIFVDGSAVVKYIVSFVPNTEQFELHFAVDIPPDTLMGAQLCNYAKTTAAPSDSQASNRKAGPSCFTVGGGLHIEKRSGTADGPLLPGAEFDVVCSPTTDTPPTIISGLSGGTVTNPDETVSASGTSATGTIAIVGPSGTPCTVTETAAPAPYVLDPTPRELVIPIGDEQTTEVFVNTAPLPTIRVDKVADPTSMPEPGGDVTFTVTVTNTSEEPLTLSSLEDDVYGTLTGDADCHGGTVLAPDASCAFSFTGAVGPDAGNYRDVVTVVAIGSNEQYATDDDDAVVTVTDVLPTITVAKVADPTSMPEPGGDAAFTVTVTNDSPEAVTITRLEDDIYGTLAGDGDCHVGTELAPGASCDFTFTGAVGPGVGDYTDVVTVDAVDDEDNTGTGSDDATVTVTDVLPTITVDKVVDPTSLDEPGGDATFTVTVTNTSVEDVTITSLEDDVYGTLAGDSDCEAGTVLAPEASCSFSFDGAVGPTPGDYTDVVTVVAVDDEGNEATDNDDATVGVQDNLPGITVTKTAAPTSLPEPGGNATFTVTVTNATDEPVMIMSLEDDVYGTLDGTVDCRVSTILLAGSSCQFSFTGAVGPDAGQYTDVVTVVAIDDENNSATDSDDATVTVTDTLPAIAVDKSASPTAIVAPGGDATFTVTVTNNSVEPVTLTDMVDDVYGPLAGDADCAAGTVLAPAASCQFSFTRPVGPAAGNHVDVVTVTAEDDEGNEATDSDDATVTITAPDGSLPFTGLDARWWLLLSAWLLIAGVALSGVPQLAALRRRS